MRLSVLNSRQVFSNHTVLRISLLARYHCPSFGESVACTHRFESCSALAAAQLTARLDVVLLLPRPRLHSPRYGPAMFAETDHEAED